MDNTELFADISINQNLDFLIGQSEDDLLKQLRSLRRETKIISIYTQGGKHIAWFYCAVKIKKLTKKE